MGEITPLELRDLLNAGTELLLLDVREHWERTIVSLPGALAIPLGEVPRRLGEIDPNQQVIVYCHHGVRSARACSFLSRAGYSSVRNLTGGIDAYAQLDPSMLRY